MLNTPSLFDDIELDDTQRRVASRRALALAHHRIESSMGKFLRGARNEDEFFERLALVSEDFAGYINMSANEVGYDSPEHTAAALRDHYRLAAGPVQFKKTPEEEQEEEEEDKEGFSSWSKNASGRRWTPRVAGPNYQQGWDPNAGSAGAYGGEGGTPYEPIGLGHCPMCGASVPSSDGVCPNCGHDGRNPYGSYNEISDVNHRQRDIGGYGGRDASVGKESLVPFQQDLAAGRAQQNPGLQNPNQVTCPECGGTNPQCPKCHGTGRAQNFGGSVLDAVAKTAEDQNNVNLGEPEPKMDKSQGPGSKPDVPGKLEEKDIIEPIIPKNTDELKEIGNIETKDLPTNSGDAGFDSGGVDSAPHTDTFNNGGQADPVTREALSSWPSDAVVQAAFTRF